MDPIGAHSLLQLFLLLACALLQAAETAFGALNINRLRREAEEGDAQALSMEKLLTRLRENPSGLQTALWTLGFGLAVSCLIAYKGLFETELHLTPALSAALLVLMIGFVFLLFARAIPMKAARRNAEKTARQLMPLARFADGLFFPMAWVLQKLSQLFVHLTGEDPLEETEQVTEDEIRMMVDAGEEKGTIEESERDMIENVFEFNNMTAEDCMTHRTDMHAVWMGDSDENILTLIEESGISRFPVYTEDLDHIVGIVTTRDYLMNRLKPKPQTLRQLLRPASFVPETVRTDVLFRKMQEDKTHMCIVVDEYGGTSGLITMEDLIEEIVGNIYDEYDALTPQEIVDKGDGRWRVNGSVEIERFNEETGLHLPRDEEYDTVGGLILNQLGSIPEDGTKPEVDVFGLHFKVVLVADRRIEWVEVTRQND